MGYLRTYLALCVVAAHSTFLVPWKMHTGQQAVQIFFIISGFYMAMILSGKYKSTKNFYISRWLRIFGPYYMLLIAIVLWSIVWGLLSSDFLTLNSYVSNPLARNGLAGILFVAITNLTLFGQDWVMFLQHDVGQRLAFTSNFGISKSPLWRYLVIPQCWSIGIEETFYLAVPFINRLKTRWLAVLLAASLAGRLIAYRSGYHTDPWSYRFFPFEAGLFLMGILGWRLYSKLNLDKFPKCRSYTYVFLVPGFIVALALHVKAVGFLGSRIGGEYAILISYPFWAVTIVFLFAYFREHKVDRFIGELCYPVYLIHYTVALTVASFLGRASGRATALIVLTLAALFFVFVLKPYEAWRHSLTGVRSKKGLPISPVPLVETSSKEAVRPAIL
jgi:peptidoglycan/LPS O-acetylase OafA/YrhL